MAGILRITREQLRARGAFDVAKLTAAGMSVTGIVCLLISTIGPIARGYAAGGIVFLMVALANFAWNYRYRAVVRDYSRESKEIQTTACAAISRLLLQGKLPKEVYEDDKRMLRKLGKANPSFRGVAKEIIDRAEKP